MFTSRECLPAMQVDLLSWKSINDIAGDGGIIKTIETEGKGWEKPKDKDEALGACCHVLSCPPSTLMPIVPWVW